MPFGRPVEPDEYIQNAMSSGSVSAHGKVVGCPSMNAAGARVEMHGLEFLSWSAEKCELGDRSERRIGVADTART